ncbi:amidohydrolase family protein [Pseudalkalibacillus decolorationis]|uniref:amidohydrolase family protein n=1 Tax=Pseudalkalibacillus decolorationis TaxID=163879 RepID=UPI002148DDF0|nr:amidohydrolase family protein [Pseudalkalibacillus decolorationis]
MLKVFRGATVYTMDETNTIIRNADIWVKDRKIVKVGCETNVPSDADVENVDGCVITPGLIDIHTHVGIWREVHEQINDANEYADPFTPQMAAIDGIDIHHFSFEMARRGGVTTIQTGAGSANPIGGIWSILKTGGSSLKEMILTEKSGLKGALGENPKNVFGQQYKKTPVTRMGVARLIRKGFQDALALSDLEREAEIANRTDLAPFIDVLEGKMPLHLHCHRADDIATAIRIAKEFQVKLCLEHCTEGHMMLEAIKESGASVTLGPYMLPSSKYETRHSTPEAPKLFYEAGIPFAIMTDHPFIPIHYLIICAVEAVKYGLDETVALRSITSEAAKLAGIHNRVGSIETEKDADFVIWSHGPFDTQANVIATYINGHAVYEKESERTCGQ